MGKARTFVFGLDSPEDYGPDYVLTALGATKPEPPVGSTVLRALFLPSFHPECLITVLDGGPNGRIELATSQESLWYYGCYLSQKAAGRLDPRNPVPAEPVQWNEGADLSRAQLEHIRQESHSFFHANPSNAPTDGCDGITVRLEFWEAGRKPILATAWSPSTDRTPEFHRLVSTVHLAASSNLPSEKSRCSLEKLFGYLDLGLSAKDLGGEPRRVRLFGRFSTDDRGELETFFASLPPDQPLIMDLSNFESMGTGLHPLFAKFVQRPGRTIWWASAPAAAHLRQVGVPADSIAATREDAEARIGK